MSHSGDVPVWPMICMQPAVGTDAGQHVLGKFLVGVHALRLASHAYVRLVYISRGAVLGFELASREFIGIWQGSTPER